MSRKKPASDSPDSDTGPVSGFPSVNIRMWMSIWVSIHLAAVVVSYTSVVEPSSLQAKLVQFLQPYLRISHFGADDRPVYLAHGDALEQPHRLQVSSSKGDARQFDDTDWRTIEGFGGRAAPGLAASDRMARFLSTVALLSRNEQPSLVAELLLPIATEDAQLTAIRIVRLPTDLNDINVEVEAVYEARIVRKEDSVSLVQLREERLSTEARPVTGGLTDE